MVCDELLLFVAELNTKSLLMGKNKTKPIGLIYIFNPQLVLLRPFDLLICVKGI